MTLSKKDDKTVTAPAATIVTADDGGVGKTTVAVQIVTAHMLADRPIDLFQMDSKAKLAAKSGEAVTSLVVSSNNRGDDLVASDVIAPWYRAVTAMGETGRSVLLEVGGAMSPLFHSGIVDLDLAEDIDELKLDVVVFVLCKAGEDSARQLLRELTRLARNLPNAKTIVVLNEVNGYPVEAAKYFADDLRKPFLSALKKYPTIRMPKVRMRSMAIYERMHALPSEIVSWHADNYREAIVRTGLPRDQAKLFTKDIAEWSAVMLEQIEQVLPHLPGGRHD